MYHIYKTNTWNKWNRINKIKQIKTIEIYKRNKNNKINKGTYSWLGFGEVDVRVKQHGDVLVSSFQSDGQGVALVLERRRQGKKN